MSSPDQSLFDGIRLLLHQLPFRRRLQLTGLLCLMVLGAVAEIATLGAVLPFLALLGDPSSADKYPWLQEVFFRMGWSNEKDILLPVTLLFGSAALAGAALRMILCWASFKLTFGIGVDIGVKAYGLALYQPYKLHLAKNSSESIAGLAKVQSLVVNVLNPMIQAVVAIVISTSIFGALMFIDVISALIAVAGFAIIYLAIMFGMRLRLRRNSRIIADSEARRVQAVQEGLGGIRDILLDGTQRIFIERFRKIETTQRKAQAENNFIGAAPRHVVESIGMTLIAILAYSLSSRTTGLATSIPILGAIAIGAQKLIPQIQQIYYGWAALSGHGKTLADVAAMLKQEVPSEFPSRHLKDSTQAGGSLSIRNLCFRYRPESPPVLWNVNLEIPLGSRVGIIGKTGAGKSTIIDILLGLLEPTSGVVEVGGQPLCKGNGQAWQARIAHVPQSIYLADSSLAENIAFGVEQALIDKMRVEGAARRAQLAEYVETLPERYETKVGERGIRLSGGQRQRIGLARAFYKDADIIILDEATSALDDQTENLVLESLNCLGQSLTVLIVAHRMSTLRFCDVVYEIRDSKISRVPGEKICA